METAAAAIVAVTLALAYGFNQLGDAYVQHCADRGGEYVENDLETFSQTLQAYSCDFERPEIKPKNRG